jgi:hypothetical protein
LQARVARGTFRPGDTAEAESLADGNGILASASDAAELAGMVFCCLSGGIMLA